MASKSIKYEAYSVDVESDIQIIQTLLTEP